MKIANPLADVVDLVPRWIQSMFKSLLDLSLVAVVAFGAQQLFKTQDQWRHAVASIVPLHVMNPGAADLKLYPIDPTAKTPIAVLRPQEWLQYDYSGSSGKWLYVSSDGQTAVVRGGVVELGIEVFGRFISVAQWLVLLALIPIAGILLARRRRVQKQLVVKQRQYAQRAEANEELITLLQHEVMLLQSKLSTAEQEARAGEATITAQKTHLERQSQAKLDAVKKYQDALSTNQSLWDEFRQRKNVEVKDLEQSLERVSQEFEQLISHVRYYDVEYRDPKFESLLKGRQFEIAMARLFRDELGCKILEWTPDKGTVFNLKTEQNGNPDLLLESPSGQRFAVECKFRSVCAHDETGELFKPKLINWASPFQGKRYADYGRTMNLNVYVALGLYGDAVSPRVQLIAPLPVLFDKSEPKEIYFLNGSSSRQLCVAHADIRELSIEGQDVANLIPEMEGNETTSLQPRVFDRA